MGIDMNKVKKFEKEESDCFKNYNKVQYKEQNRPW